MKVKKFIAFCMLLLLGGTLELKADAIERLFASDEIMEAEKLYMQPEARPEESPIDVIIEGNEEERGSENLAQIDTEYPFEKSLLDENIEELSLENGGKIADEINNPENRRVKISKAEYELIDNFTEDFLNTYVSREFPDFSAYYDQSSKAREENRFLIEAYIYDLAFIKDNTVESFDRELNITRVTPLAEGMNEVVFYLIQHLHTDEGEEGGGKWFVANVAKTEEGYKFLKLWVESPEYEIMQEHLKDDYLQESIPLEKERIIEELLEEERGETVPTMFLNVFGRAQAGGLTG